MSPSAPTNLAIDVRGLVKRFDDKVAVDGVDIQLPQGQVWGFLGPNGSGKTTTIRMICGLLRPSAGEGRCLGFDILKDSARIKRATGYMTQKFSFWGDLTIRENLDFVARLYQMPNRRRSVDETLDTLGLTHRQHQVAGALSGGWKQRLALAAVTMHQPRLLLLDEPTAGVDPQARRDFWDEIHRLSTAGLTVLVSTHYMDEAERCDRIVYLANGKLITQGQVADIIAESGLITFRAKGPGVRELAEVLRHQPGVDHAAYFGAALHISGPERRALQRAVAGADGENVTWEEVEPSLEDAFIALMARAGSDKRDHG
ncbi:ABC transporter ATP-binding protein [Pelagibius litoralis]|uniref:ABC transporter ATP-binding protein n=1 Tax=Pelagibius litoralis TaxID=374515 RepID=A0A967C4J5_9PROT|nr:ABC transporter ATP-binding protein [Pelagibius litoralis]NIA68265.1 ABC transporter ATP-binding protein [Pelagibius litoralis]